jgi:hypothetical protein
MEAAIKEQLESIQFGEMQAVHNMALVPLVLAPKRGPRYITLDEALAGQLVSVGEVDSGGSVPELRVVNRADLSVLLLDGEELAGAKQNRVLNTSILLGKKSETVIPVSCTEAGRWSYTSAGFGASGVVMPPALRAPKARSVTSSLRAHRSFRSDQRQVWDGIADQTARASVRSPSGAMRDAFTARQQELDDYVAGFPCNEGQHGLLVFIGGRVVGFDVVSRAEAYAQLHGKLVRSYAMDALLARDRGHGQGSPEAARAFVASSTQCEGERHKSVGQGWDHRFMGEGLVGSALVHMERVVHAAFFRASEADKAGRMSSHGQRRRFRL